MRYRIYKHGHEHVHTVDVANETEALAEIARTEGYTAQPDDPVRAAVRAACSGEPRRSPTPCDPTCEGWDVFEVDRCTVHGDDCDLSQPDCSRLEIEACIACWADVPGGLTDDDYAQHPVCIAKLARERATERGGSNGQA